MFLRICVGQRGVPKGREILAVLHLMTSVACAKLCRGPLAWSSHRLKDQEGSDADGGANADGGFGK